MPDLTCPTCKQSFPALDVLRASSGYSLVTRSGSSTCPACHADLEYRVSTGTVELGYTYWAGSLHFEAVAAFPVETLRLVTVGDRVDAVVGSRSFQLTRPPLSSPS